MFSRRKIYLFALSLPIASVIVAAPAGKVKAVDEKACDFPPMTHPDINALEWVTDEGFLCGGYFRSKTITFSPDFVLKHADYVALTPKGADAKGHVLAYKNDQEFKADKVHIVRGKKKVERLDLSGHVSARESEQFVKARTITYFPESGYGEMLHAIYVMKFRDSSSWGQACTIKRLAPGKVEFHQVTYSTCAPDNVVWHIKAKQIALDKVNKRGSARNAKIYVGDYPLLYLPYFSFPLDKSRKTGLLMPKYHYNTQNGSSLQIPYYLNLAPNYDATFLPRYYELRGMQWAGEFRYLLPSTTGTLQGDFVFKDKAFQQFKQDNASRLPSLLNLGDNRYSVKYRSQSKWENGIHLSFDYQKVSDDYYLQDFGNNLSLASNQLPQRVQADYSTTHWNLTGMVARYQTLHPFNESELRDIYARTPKIRADGKYLNLPYNSSFTVDLDFERLDWRGNNAQTTPEGLRYYARPSLTTTQYGRYGYIKPSVYLPSTYYDLNNYQNQHRSFSRVIPQSSIEWGATLAKSLSDSMTETLEPRVYYLYVPFQDQSALPVFDSGYLQSNYNQLFRPNRFGGIDRVGDANQVSFGVSSRFLVYGEEALRLSVGSAYRFEAERVNLCFDGSNRACRDEDGRGRLNFSSGAQGLVPVMAEAETGLFRNASLLGNIAWDTKNSRVNNALLNFHYEPEVNHIVNVSYGYVLNGDPINLSTGVFNNTNLHQIRLSYAWPLSVHWRGLGAYAYSFSQRYTPIYFMGLEYDSCCTAVRFVGGRSYLAYNTAGRARYSDTVALQILFKGLGNFASSDPNRLLRQYIPTYQDNYRQGFRL